MRREVFGGSNAMRCDTVRVWSKCAEESLGTRTGDVGEVQVKKFGRCSSLKGVALPDFQFPRRVDVSL